MDTFRKNRNFDADRSSFCPWAVLILMASRLGWDDRDFRGQPNRGAERVCFYYFGFSCRPQAEVRWLLYRTTRFHRCIQMPLSHCVVYSVCNGIVVSMNCRCCENDLTETILNSTACQHICIERYISEHKYHYLYTTLPLWLLREPFWRTQS